MQSQVVFLHSLGWHLDRLQALLGDRWPEVKAKLDKLLIELVEEEDERTLPARVNRIYRVFEGTPAESFVRALFREIGGLEQQPRSGTRIFGISPPPMPAKGVASNKAQIAHAATVLTDSIALHAEVGEPPQTTLDADKRINAWISECITDPTRPLTLGERCTLNLGVGQELSGSIIDGKGATIDAKDLAGGGMQTEWLISTSAFGLASDDPQVTVRPTATAAPGLSTAEFSLWIPEEGESEVRRIFLVPRPSPSHRLGVLIYAVDDSRKELYRQFSIEVSVAGGRIAEREASVRDELICANGVEMNLRTTHEWTTPPGRLIVTVLETKNAAVVGELPRGPVDGDIVDWHGQPANIAGSIRNLRESAENFRGKWGQYLNDIDPQDLLRRLSQFTPTYDWALWQSQADQRHADSWMKASSSQDLRDLAVFGHELYETMFPPDSKLRIWIDALLPGYRLDISWTEASGAGYVPNVPWGLMYLPDPPAPGQAVDPLGFLTLRFRIGYRGYLGVSAASKALGALANAHQAYCLYWGTQPNDEKGQEALWQRQHFQRWQNQIFIPQTPGSPGARAEVIQAFSTPPRSPTSLIYFFCEAEVGEGNKPVLQFGPAYPADVVQTTDLISSKRFEDSPLVFANACLTSAADPYTTNLLEKNLFRRGCRGFLGTETKVPIQLASRFAMIFFNFFYRNVDPEPMAAGEAIAQSRLFLLTQYANIGGIFYTYLNQYELYMADKAEVQALRAN
jgi:hypothetical protein